MTAALLVSGFILTGSAASRGPARAWLRWRYVLDLADVQRPAACFDVRLDLRPELLQRTEQDQAARSAPEPDWKIVAAVDADNLAWLREVVAEVGWPG